MGREETKQGRMSSTPKTPRKKIPSNQPPTSTKKKRISKDQKICELKSELELSKEENSRLRKELERLKTSKDSGNTSYADQPHNEDQQKRFREAMKAVKKVTVKQEMYIRSLRRKAKERRHELKQKDEQIKTLTLKLMSLEKFNQTLQKSQGNSDLVAKNRKLQSAFDEIRQRKDELEELLDRKESQLESLNRKPKGQSLPNNKRGGRDTPSDGESVGSGSLQSVSTSQTVSTAGEFDVTRLKTELAKKQEKILELQMNLESVKDELHDLKQFGAFQSNDGFGNHSKPFAVSDDWTDAETENEADFGDMQFGESFFEPKQGGDVDFW